MTAWMNLGQQLKINARKYADKLALKDEDRRFTFSQTNRRVNQLANGLAKLGLTRGDKVAVMMDNSIEIVELYMATAKAGLIIVPINFRLVSREVAYIVNNSDAKALFVQNALAPVIDPIKTALKNIEPDNYFITGQPCEDYRDYESFISTAPESEPDVNVSAKDTWILIYTSGTTGKPKGVVRSHESHIAFWLLNAIDFGFSENDYCMTVMPLCHINSVYYTFLFTYIGASVYVHTAQAFNASAVLDIIERENISFTSLVPTHYNLILSTERAKNKKTVTAIRKLLCSSAPARKSLKLAIMAFFPNAELYEAYGSTEAGIVTVLKPEDQMRKLGSIGRESLGTERVKILGKDGEEVPVEEVGEIFSRGPMLFDAYYKLPEKTESSFRGGWFSAGDMGMQDEEGYYYIVDRKDNMIITGGENVYPSEIEEVVGSHECVFDCACIGVPDEKWGEKVVAVVVTKDGMSEDDINEDVIRECCQDKLAGFKRPKEVVFIKPEDMPRTPTGKILHRKLREKLTE